MVMFNQRRLARTVETRNFVENQPITVDLPLGYDLNSIVVKLSGTITVGTAPTTYHVHKAPRLIERIDLYANGKNKYAEIDGMSACLANFERSLANTLTDVAAGTGAKTVEAYFRLDLDTADGLRPKDSALHTVKPFMSKLQAKIQCNAFADMCVTVGPLVISSHTLTLEVMTEETIEYSDVSYFEDRLVKVRSLSEETINATKTSHRVKLAAGELMTRGVIIASYDNTGALVNNVVNNAQLKSGVDVAIQKSWSDYREFNKASYRLQGTQLPDGFAFIDLCPGGNLNQLWDTRGKTELDLILDVTKPAGGDGKLVIIPVQYYEQNNAELRQALSGQM